VETDVGQVVNNEEVTRETVGKEICAVGSSPKW